MPYEVLPVEDADIPEVTQLICDSFVQDGLQEYVSATWPGMDTPQGRIAACSRFRSIRGHLPDPSHFLKVVDERTRSTVACSISFYNSEPPKSLSGLSGSLWATEDDRDYADHLRRERNGLLLRIFARMQGPVTEVMAFCVGASVQRQGIGTLLMQHLANMDIQRGLPLILIAKPKAKEFYQKQGFKVVEDATLEVPERWQSRPRAHLISMIREI